MSTHTFLWHDYETFGADPRRDRPAQFAAIRTDAQLNEIGEPLMLYCQPSHDYVPDPQSCLITGITPQLAQERGVSEREFAARIEAAMAQPGTISVGYNTIRFDDEFTRHLFWRNLIDPYAREWQNQCGRWDLLDVVRMAHALRPEGVVWPRKEDGTASFKLEHLSRANGLAHEAAHDALSDVRATIALARLLRDTNPRLFEFALSLHKKERVAQELHLPVTAQTARPFLHISGMFPAERGCLALVWPLAQHPSNKNEIIVWDLAHDPSELAGMDAPALRERLFTASAALPAGIKRLPIKTIHLNKSPMVVSNLKTLTPERAQHWQIDIAQALAHAAIARDLPDMSAIWASVFSRPAEAPDADPEQSLYAGFVANAERSRLNELRALSGEALARAKGSFDDPRLNELVWRYRMRNFPASASPQDQARWQAHCAARLLEGAGSARTLEQLFAEIDQLSENADERGEEILGALYDWVDSIAPER